VRGGRVSGAGVRGWRECSRYYFVAGRGSSRVGMSSTGVVGMEGVVQG
jgi:hypothetical protein